jgi:hypothetical protein
MRFKCHNCDFAATLPEFIKRMNKDLYLEYLQADTSQPVIQCAANSNLNVAPSS